MKFQKYVGIGLIFLADLANAAQPRKEKKIYYVPYYVPQVSKPLPSRFNRFVISGLLGLDNPMSGDQSGSNPGFGVSGGYTLTPRWTLGMGFQNINTTPSELGQSMQATSSFNTLFFLADYNFPGLENLWVGARLGAGIRTSSFSIPTAGSSSLNAILYGFMAGWRFQILDALALNPQAGLLILTTPVSTIDICVLLAIQYWP
jgi:hypothetical protein